MRRGSSCAGSRRASSSGSWRPRCCSRCRRRARAGRERDDLDPGHRAAARHDHRRPLHAGRQGPLPRRRPVPWLRQGVTPNGPAWAQWLQSEGYAALVVDSFQGRGLRNLCADSRPLMPAVRAADVYAAAAKLKSMGVVDGDRIAAMGFSHGGGTVLAAWRTQSKHPDVTLRALIALYPGCGSQQLPPPDAAPLLILAGAKDDWTPAEKLPKLVDTRARRAPGHDRGLSRRAPSLRRRASEEAGLRLDRQGRQGRDRRVQSESARGFGEAGEAVPRGPASSRDGRSPPYCSG